MKDKKENKPDVKIVELNDDVIQTSDELPVKPF